MKRFLDTSVLVATVLAQHPHHLRSLAVYAQSNKQDSYCSGHSIAETYATLTRLPGKHRMSCEQALLFLDDVRKRLTIVTLAEADYYAVITSAVAQDVQGGTIYDALIARCAIKSGSDVFYTWNDSDFRRLGPDVAKRLRTP